MKLPLSYYQSDNVVCIARDLLGKVLFTNIDDKITGGIITETEAYAGITDKASHAYGGLRTKRTDVMYQMGGCSYVYLCYGIHYLFNVVIGPINRPHAVLIRGIIPIDGHDEMAKRIGKKAIRYKDTNGPGKLTKALGISLKFSNKFLTSNIVWIEDKDIKINKADVLTSKRIGIEYANEDSLLPYRFNIYPENL